jgi:hypothetical protein
MTRVDPHLEAILLQLVSAFLKFETYQAILSSLEDRALTTGQKLLATMAANAA